MKSTKEATRKRSEEERVGLRRQEFNRIGLERLEGEGIEAG